MNEVQAAGEALALERENINKTAASIADPDFAIHLNAHPNQKTFFNS
jgi:hypothetical protein